MPLLLLVLMLLAAPAAAQSADALYHDAAALYIGGDDARAEAAALRGLQIEPDHARLRALLDAIRQRDPGAGGSPDADEPSPGAGPPQPGENGASPEPDGASDQEPDADGEPDTNDGPAGDADAAQPGAAGAPADAEPGGLSREDAERILRAVDADEQDLLRRIQRRPERPHSATYPDW